MIFHKKLKNKFRSTDVKKNRFCPVSEQKQQGFLPLHESFLKAFDQHGFVHSIFQFETLNVLEYSCPQCYSSDRDRLYAAYLKKRINGANYNVLDFAPSPSFKKWMLSHDNINYRTADLMLEGVDDKVDITNMHIYQDENFDIIICSHVLEHVEDDQKAVSELHRVLKKDGFAMLMVPIMLTLDDTLKKDTIQSVSERWKYYGQDDHVRMYSKSGFVNLLTEGGFEVEQVDALSLGQDEMNKIGVHPRSVLYIVKKCK